MLIQGVSEPLQFIVDPFVADIIDDVIIDKFTAIHIGALVINVPESVLCRREVRYEHCGAVFADQGDCTK
jgi:hypothetical protein